MRRRVFRAELANVSKVGLKGADGVLMEYLGPEQEAELGTGGVRGHSDLSNWRVSVG